MEGRTRARYWNDGMLETIFRGCGDSVAGSPPSRLRSAGRERRGQRRGVPPPATNRWRRDSGKRTRPDDELTRATLAKLSRGGSPPNNGEVLAPAVDLAALRLLNPAGAARAGPRAPSHSSALEGLEVPPPSPAPWHGPGHFTNECLGASKRRRGSRKVPAAAHERTGTKQLCFVEMVVNR